MFDVVNFFQTEGILLIFKVLLLALIFVYAIFTLIVLSRVQALNRTIFLAASHASVTLHILTLISFLLAVSLFILTLVIV